MKQSRAKVPPSPKKTKETRYRILAWQRRYPDAKSEWLTVGLLIGRYAAREDAELVAAVKQGKEGGPWIRFVVAEEPK
jgi:hypothetical protein